MSASVWSDLEDLLRSHGDEHVANILGQAFSRAVAETYLIQRIKDTLPAVLVEGIEIPIPAIAKVFDLVVSRLGGIERVRREFKRENACDLLHFDWSLNYNVSSDRVADTGEMLATVALERVDHLITDFELNKSELDTLLTKFDTIAAVI